MSNTFTSNQQASDCADATSSIGIIIKDFSEEINFENNVFTGSISGGDYATYIHIESTTSSDNVKIWKEEKNNIDLDKTPSFNSGCNNDGYGAIAVLDNTKKIEVVITDTVFRGNSGFYGAAIFVK